MTAVAVAQAVGLHPNTVRGHLDLLVHLGHVRRSVEPRDRPGRPRVLFAALDQQSRADPYRVLATALTASSSAVDRTADWWTDALARAGRITACADPDEAVRQVAAAFDDVGFDTRTDPVGDRLLLTRCPYASMVADAPVVCDIHVRLLDASFKATGAPVSVASLDVLTRPGVCVAHLVRTDVAPVRTLRPAPDRTPAPPVGATQGEEP